jgi:hypothetical protein
MGAKGGEVALEERVVEPAEGFGVLELAAVEGQLEGPADVGVEGGEVARA